MSRLNQCRSQNGELHRQQSGRRWASAAPARAYSVPTSSTAGTGLLQFPTRWPRTEPASRDGDAARRGGGFQTSSHRPGRTPRTPRWSRRGVPLRPCDLASMLNRASGNSASSSESRGMGSIPWIRASADLCIAQIGNRASVVGDPIEHPIMEGQQHSVARGVHVGLQVAVAEGDRLLERVQAVLAIEIGLVGCSAAMRDMPRTARRRTRSQRPSWPHCALWAVMGPAVIAQEGAAEVGGRSRAATRGPKRQQ